VEKIQRVVEPGGETDRKQLGDAATLNIENLNPTHFISVRF